MKQKPVFMRPLGLREASRMPAGHIRLGRFTDILLQVGKKKGDYAQLWFDNTASWRHTIPAPGSDCWVLS